MKCTDCGTEIKPVVAVDIDGTLGMYHEHFTEFATEYIGMPLKRGYDGGDEFSDYLGMSKQSYREAKLAYRQGGMKRTMPLYSGAQMFMRGLGLMRPMIEVWIATTRPWMRLDNIDPDTRNWLYRNNIKYDYMIYGDDKYEVLKSRVGQDRILMVVDDLTAECWIASEVLDVDSETDPRTWPVVQPARVHNQVNPFPSRVETFEFMLNRLTERLGAWHAERERAHI